MNFFFAVLSSNFKAFGDTKSCIIEQDQALKDTVFPLRYKIQNLKDLKNSYF